MSYENLSNDDLRAAYDGRIEDLSDDALRQVYKETKPTFTERVAEHKDSLQATGKPSPREWFNDAEIEEGVDVGKRVLQGVADPIHGGAQLLSHLVPQGIADVAKAADQWLYDKSAGWLGHNQGIDADLAAREKEYQATQAPEGFDAARAVGNVIGGFAIPGGSGKSLLGLVTGGALGGLATPVTDTSEESYANQKVKQSALGAATGALAKAILPQFQTKAGVDVMKDAGINPSFGQTFGGLAEKVEQKATSIPIVGDIIAGARARPREEFNQAIFNKAYQAADKTAPKLIGAPGYDEALEAVGQQYQKGFSTIPKEAAENAYDHAEIMKFLRAAGVTKGMSDEMIGELERVVYSAKRPYGNVTPKQAANIFKMTDSDIGTFANDYLRSGQARDKQIGRAIKAYQDTARMRLQTYATDAGGDVSGLNQADLMRSYLYPIGKATDASYAHGGVFTPGQLLRQVKGKAGDASKDLKKFAATAQHVIGNQYPDSGTAGRLLQGTLLNNPLHTAGLVVGASMYAPLIQDAIIFYMKAGHPLVDAIKLATAKAAPQTLTRKEARAK